MLGNNIPSPFPQNSNLFGRDDEVEGDFIPILMHIFPSDFVSFIKMVLQTLACPKMAETEGTDSFDWDIFFAPSMPDF